MERGTHNLFVDPFIDLKTKSVKKGAILLSPGEHERYAYRVTKGCLRSYVSDAAGKKHILQFAPEGWYISDMNSLLNNAEAIVTIDAIEDSEFLVYDKTILKLTDMPYELLVKQFTALQNNIIATNKRLIHLLSSTAEERYLDFIETYPELAKRLPLKQIAAYLGISPEFVSRIPQKDCAQMKNLFS